MVRRIVELRELVTPSITSILPSLCFHNHNVLELGAGAAQEIADLHVQGAAGYEFNAVLEPETMN